EKEIESIGVNLVDNGIFNTKNSVYEVITANEDVDRVISNGVPLYLLGVYSDTEFGKLKASIVTQLNLPVTGENYNYGDNVTIDDVIVDVPYQSTLDTIINGVNKFSLDDVLGESDVEFQLNVFELGTFLNTLDPNDPTKTMLYYSDRDYVKQGSSLYTGNYKVNPNDTVVYVNRYLFDGVTVYDKDTIKQSDLGPSLKIHLNKGLIQERFVDNASGVEFLSTEAFQKEFKGLYIEAEELAVEKSHLIPLDLTKAKMTIYYSNDEDEGIEITDENGVITYEGLDLNGNGVKGEGIVRVKQQYVFPFGTIKSNVLKRDRDNSKASGNDRLYVQGAAGSIATIELTEIGEQLADLQDNNWLITDASLIFYVDQNASSDIEPEQLFLYNYDDNEQLLDMITEGLNSFGGTLERDDAGEPYRYVFKITDYISELLTSNEPLDLVKLGLKVYNSTDSPLNITDTTIKNFSWNPRGVVLFGSDISAGEKRIKLEISYSEINN
ncbi:DUF4270 domain-containing protein, partial [Lutibacter sp.]|uniref:DUF4270 domain-containing protein n=1 Tax=Lutibacter sp. TaxID=1925666 RepID=UPI00356235A6